MISLLKFIKEWVIDLRIKRAKIQRYFIENKPLESILDYWKRPNDGTNNPKDYASKKSSHKRSEKLTVIIKDLIVNTGDILEIGCNGGRNLNHLYMAGYSNLTGVEISNDALDEFKNSFEVCYEQSTIINDSIEDAIINFNDCQFDIVYTVAVLQHIHPESEWIFDHMVRITRVYLITWEVENYPSYRHYPRNYKKVFEKRGMKQINRIGGIRIFRKK